MALQHALVFKAVLPILDPVTKAKHPSRTHPHDVSMHRPWDAWQAKA